MPSTEAFKIHLLTNLPSHEVSVPKLIDVNGTCEPGLDSNVFKL